MIARIPLLFAGLVLAASVGPSSADTLITMRSETETSGSAPTVESSSLWVGENRIRENRTGLSVIVDLERATLFLLDHEARRYHALDLPIDLARLLPDAMLEQLRRQAEQMALEVEVSPSNETREIGDYTARRFDIAMRNPLGLETDVELWATTGIGVDLTAYKSLMVEMATLQGMGGAWVEKILEIEGFPVVRRTTVSFGDSRAVTHEELVSVERRPAPAGTYEPPQAYRHEPLIPTGEPPTASP